MSQKRAVHLMLPCPPPTRHRAWGDYYFGQSLAAALRHLGHDVYISMTHGSGTGWRHKLADWWRQRQLVVPQEAVEVALFGQHPVPDDTGRLRIIWLISNSDRIERDVLSGADHLFVASHAFAARLRAGGVACEVLLQCTDPERFCPDRAAPEYASDLLFVGNRGPYEPRPIVENAVQAGYDVTVWGQGWQMQADQLRYRGIHIANEELGRHYASANVVLNDHRRAMLEDMFISNRVYDSLACGRPVVTEEMEGMPEAFQGGALTYRTADDIGAAIEAARACPAAALSDISRYTREKHSFLRRAEVISARISETA